MRDNTSAGLGWDCHSPYFNGWQVNTNIANARISLENSQLELQSRKIHCMLPFNRLMQMPWPP